MDIYYLGHSSFRLVGKDLSLVTDPFDPKSVGFKYPSVEANVVTVSHDHADHNASDSVSDVHKVLKGPGEYEINKVSITGLPSYHDDKKGAERGKNTIYVIEIEGLRVVHLGDLGHKLSESEIEALGNVDILMVPVGGVYTIDYRVAAELVRAIEPRVIIPMHYKTPEHDPKTFADLDPVEEFITELGVRKEESKKYSVKQGSLNPDDQVVIVMEHGKR